MLETQLVSSSTSLGGSTGSLAVQKIAWLTGLIDNVFRCKDRLSTQHLGM
jgi:hypothetical protein